MKLKEPTKKMIDDSVKAMRQDFKKTLQSVTDILLNPDLKTPRKYIPSSKKGRKK